MSKLPLDRVLPLQGFGTRKWCRELVGEGALIKGQGREARRAEASGSPGASAPAASSTPLSRLIGVTPLKAGYQLRKEITECPR